MLYFPNDLVVPCCSKPQDIVSCCSRRHWIFVFRFSSVWYQKSCEVLFGQLLVGLMQFCLSARVVWKLSNLQYYRRGIERLPIKSHCLNKVFLMFPLIVDYSFLFYSVFEFGWLPVLCPAGGFLAKGKLIVASLWLPRLQRITTCRDSVIISLLVFYSFVLYPRNIWLFVEASHRFCGSGKTLDHSADTPWNPLDFFLVTEHTDLAYIASYLHTEKSKISMISQTISVLLTCSTVSRPTTSLWQGCFCMQAHNRFD